MAPLLITVCALAFAGWFYFFALGLVLTPEVKMHRFGVEIKNCEAAPWPAPVTVYLNGKPPDGYVYTHGQPILPGETVEIPLSEFQKDGEAIDPTATEPCVVQILAGNRESMRWSSWPPKQKTARECGCRSALCESVPRIG